jgi:hypothetical protein
MRPATTIVLLILMLMILIAGAIFTIQVLTTS